MKTNPYGKNKWLLWGFIIGAFVLLISAHVRSQPSIQSSFDQSLTAQELQSDVEILRTGLEKIHPGLYRYNTKDYMDSVFSEAKSVAAHELSYADFYQLVCATVASIKCNHTIAAPAPEMLSQIRNKRVFFPLRVYWEFDPVQAFVSFDFSSDADLPPGTKIRSINGQSIDEIYDFLISFFSSDGNILSNKHSRLQWGMDFQMWFYLLIDRPDTFDVELEYSDGQVINKTYAPVTVKEWTKNYKKYISRKDPEIKGYADFWVDSDRQNRSNPIRHEFVSDDIALITVLNFDHHKFEKIIDKVFIDINKKGADKYLSPKSDQDRRHAARNWIDDAQVTDAIGRI